MRNNCSVCVCVCARVCVCVCQLLLGWLLKSECGSLSVSVLPGQSTGGPRQLWRGPGAAQRSVKIEAQVSALREHFFSPCLAKFLGGKSL